MLNLLRKNTKNSSFNLDFFVLTNSFGEGWGQANTQLVYNLRKTIFGFDFD